jgi:ankyrin repeat protein
MTGNVDIVKAILDKGANINARDDKGSSALTWAAFMDSSEVVQLLISRGAIYDLSFAAISGYKVEVKRFLDAGVDVNATDGLGWTPLIYAAQKGHAGVVELLLERGADPAKRVKGLTAFDRGLSRVLGDLILEKGIGILPKVGATKVLVRACGDGRIDVVKHLLANGVDVNQGLPGRYDSVLLPFTALPYGPGFTPLMAACAGDRIATAKVLLDHGADVNKRDAKGDTALIHAALSGAVPALKLLLANGVDVDQRDAKGWTALMQATLDGEMESIAFLLANGSDVNARNEHGYTALNMNCDGPIHDLLKAHGARVYKRVIVGQPSGF